MSRARSLAMFAALSLGAHAVVALVLLRAPLPSSFAAHVAIPFELGGAFALSALSTEGDDAQAASPAAPAPEPGGVRALQNVDADARGGRGDPTGARAAILGMDRAEGILLLDAPLNNTAAAQTQRIRTSRLRASYERRRATPHPAAAPFLASGAGIHHERRTPSPIDSASGARSAPEASELGARATIAIIWAGQDDAISSSAASASRTTGMAQRSPGVGILHGAGARRRAAADVAHGRPPVDEGNAAAQASRVDRPNDVADTEMLAASMVESWVDSTLRTGPREGPGSGGVGGDGPPGSADERREGGRAPSFGPGHGAFDALDTNDARYVRWFLESRRRVEEGLRFPRRRALAMDQGTAVYRIVVRRDGALEGAPELVRSSGFDDLDGAALAAIRAATPFSPMPDGVAPSHDRLRLTMPVELSNPMVR